MLLRSALLEDPRNLRIMLELVSGDAMSVNVNQLSRSLGRHRATIDHRVKEMMKHCVLDPPFYPFHGVFRVYPVLAIINLDTRGFNSQGGGLVRWMREDPHIFAAFHSRRWSRDTLLLTYHESVASHQLWMKAIPESLSTRYGVDGKQGDLQSSVSYISNQLMVKYSPGSGVNLIEKTVREEGSVTLGGLELDELDVRIMRSLIEGKGIKTNISRLSAVSGLHRKTVEKRVNLLLTGRYIADPVCRFPEFLVPPGYLLTITKAQVKRLDEALISHLIEDPHVPVAIQTANEAGNLLLLGNHVDVDSYLGWVEDLRGLFPDMIGDISTTYLPPETVVAFNHKMVALGYIKRMLGEDGGRD
jgi:predicted transcriptional regulator